MKSMGAVDEIRRRGWEQGALIPAAPACALPFRCPLAVEDDAVFVVISQSCDVVQHSLENEPYVEVLKARRAVETDGNLSHGKHPRLVQFEIAGEIYEASSKDRTTFPREELAKIDPDARRLTGRTIDMLAEWITKRYIRPAFPDELNRRIDAQRGKIREVLKKHGETIDQILLHHSPDDELHEGEGNYLIALKLVMSDDDCADPSKKDAALKAILPLGKALGACAGIKVLDCSLTQESKVTLDDLRHASPWDFDYLTHRARGS